MLISKFRNNFYQKFLYTAERVKQESRSMHLHDLYEIVYLRTGSCSVTIDGMQTELQAGDACLISPWTTHSVDSQNASDLFMLSFSENCIPCCGELRQTDRPIIFRPSENCIDQLSVHLIDRECDDPYLLFFCINYLMSDYSKQTKDHTAIHPTPRDNDLVPRALAYMKQHFQENITLSSLSKNIGSNASYLSRLLNQNNGLGFSGYLNVFRLSYAESLLRTTKKPINEIAAESGFGSVRTFNRVFDSHYHQKPTDLRKQEKDHPK